MIPKSGTSTMRDIITRCLDLRMVVANDLFDHRNKRLEVVDLGYKMGRYVNVDFSVKGMKNAKRLNLASSGLVDVAIAFSATVGFLICALPLLIKYIEDLKVSSQCTYVIESICLKVQLSK